jgi:acid phosphatase
LLVPGVASAAAVPRPDHILVVIEENHAQGEIIGNANAPYITGLSKSGANFTNSHAETHPS